MDINTILARKGSDVHTISSKATIGDAVDRMVTTGVSALVVSDDGSTIAGIVSDRGIIRAMATRGGDIMGEPLKTVMTADVITCQPADSVQHVMTIMSTKRIRHVPVVDADATLIGLVSIGDVVQNRLDAMTEETTAMRDYIAGAH